MNPPWYNSDGTLNVAQLVEDFINGGLGMEDHLTPEEIRAIEEYEG